MQHNTRTTLTDEYLTLNYHYIYNPLSIDHTPQHTERDIVTLQ